MTAACCRLGARVAALATALAVVFGAGLLGTAPAVAAGAAPVCTAVLFVPQGGGGAYLVEQPNSAPGAIFCDDAEDDPLTFTVVEAPAHGTLSPLQPNGLGGATYGYTPVLGFAGDDSFVLRANDGTSDSAEIEVRVTVGLAVDDPPDCAIGLAADATGGVYAVEAGEPVAGSIDCSDDEQDALTFAVHAAPQHGTLSAPVADGVGGADFAYTPDPGYAGPDGFALVANDGTHDSSPAEVAVAVVAPVNDPPRCSASLTTTTDASGAYEVEQGETAPGSVLCVDDEDDPLGFAVAAAPRHGALAPLTAAGAGGVDLAYAPAPGYAGFDDFRLEVTDGVNPDVAVKVRVRAVPARDDAPTCTVELATEVVAGRYRVEQGDSVAGRLRCVDDEGAELDHAVHRAPQHGVVGPIGPDGDFTYGAAADYVGPDSLALTAGDGAREAEPVELAIDVVAASNDPPRCEASLATGVDDDGAFLVEQGDEVAGRVVCHDDEGAELSFAIAAVPDHGSLAALEREGPARTRIAYTAAAGYLGPDRFAIAVDDGVNAPRQLEVAVEVVAPSPDAPNCQARLYTASDAGAYAVEAGETVAGALTCFDPDGDELAFSVARAPDRGALGALERTAPDSAGFTYTAPSGPLGADSLALVASDGGHGSNVVELELSIVAAVDDPPACAATLFSAKSAAGAYAAEQGSPERGTVVCTDDEDDELSFSVVEPAEHGQVAQLDGDGESASFVYTADPAYLGPDALAIRASDGAGGADTAELVVDVGPAVDDAPVCSAELDAPLDESGVHRVDAGAPVAGEIGCVDDEGQPLSFAVAQQPAHGTVGPFAGSGDARTFTYTANWRYAGSDVVALTASDGTQSSTPVELHVVVENADTVAPTTTDDVPAAAQGAAVAVTLTATDGAGSGVDRTYYERGASPPAPTTASPVYDPAAKPALSDGERIRYFSVDRAGNAEALRSSAVVRVQTSTGPGPGPGTDPGPGTGAPPGPGPAPPAVPGPGAAPPRAAPAPTGCAALPVKRRSACELARKVSRTCGKLAKARKLRCAKRLQALAKCRQLAAKRRASCQRKAKRRWPVG